MDSTVKFARETATPSGINNVLYIQQALNKLGAQPPLVEDGILGPLTLRAMADRLKKEQP